MLTYLFALYLDLVASALSICFRIGVSHHWSVN